MDSQLTLRLPKELDRTLAREARARGVKKSFLVREAVAQYLAAPRSPSADEVWEASLPFIGCYAGDYDAAMLDPVARQIQDHNFRE